MPKPITAVLILLITAWVTAAGAVGAEDAGIVKSVDGQAFVVRSGEAFQAEVNTPVKKGDKVTTGENGRVGLILGDDTIVTVGPGGELVIDEFLFSPAEQELSLVLRVLKGTLSFLSGQIARLAPENVRLETPEATIGMRGTRVLVSVE